MPSSLARVLSRALGFSPHLPVSVYGTGSMSSRLEGFLGSMESVPSLNKELPITPQLNNSTDLPILKCLHAWTHIHQCAAHILLRHLITQTNSSRYRNINLLSIDFPFRVHLRSRLTLGGRTFPRKPWVFGGHDSHMSFRYSCRNSHFRFVQRSFRYAFFLQRNAPLP